MILDLLENTMNEVVRKDGEFIKLEAEKDKLLRELKETVGEEDMKRVMRLIDCMDVQNLITAMGFSFFRVLDMANYKGWDK